MSFYRLAGKILSFLVKILPNWVKDRLEKLVFTDQPRNLPTGIHDHLETFALLLGGGDGRARVAANLYEQGIVSRIIVSGGTGPFTINTDEPEAEYLRRELIEYGVEDHHILCEDASTNTLENMKFSLNLLLEYYPADQSTNCFNIIVVTSNFHIKRSVALLKKQLIGFPHMVNVFWYGSFYPDCELATWRDNPDGRELVAKELIRLAQYHLTRQI